MARNYRLLYGTFAVYYYIFRICIIKDQQKHVQTARHISVTHPRSPSMYTAYSTCLNIRPLAGREYSCTYQTRVSKHLSFEHQEISRTVDITTARKVTRSCRKMLNFAETAAITSKAHNHVEHYRTYFSTSRRCSNRLRRLLVFRPAHTRA